MKSAKIVIAHVIALVCLSLTLFACNGHKITPAEATADSLAADTVIADTTARDTVVTPAGDSILVPPSTYQFRPGTKVEGKLICLTFDDGPNNVGTPVVLDVLKKYGAHATFFCVGSCIKESTHEVMRRAVAEGNEICSHTYSHPFLTSTSYEKVQQEIHATNEAIKEAVGYYPNFYRPPYLDVDQIVLREIDMPAITGSASDDWMKSHTPEMIVETVMKTAKPNAVYIMHDLGANKRTPVALETLIPRLQSEGYTLVTLTDLYTSLDIIPKAHSLYSAPKREYKPAPMSNRRARLTHRAAAPSAPAQPAKTHSPATATKPADSPTQAATAELEPAAEAPAEKKAEPEPQAGLAQE